MGLKSVFSSPKDSIMGIKGDTKISVGCAVPTISKKGSSILVSVMPERADFGIKGYYHESAKFAEIIEKAAKEGLEIMILTEKHRKKGVSEDTPIAELTVDTGTARKNIVYACVGVYDFNNDKWILDGNQVSPENHPSEIRQAIENAKQGSEDIDTEKFFETPKPTVKIPNPQKFDMQQHLTVFYFHLLSLEKKYGFELSDDNHRREFAVKMLTLADEFQKLIKEVDIVDHKDYSHTRARSLVFQCEEHFHNLNQEASKNIQKWQKEMYKTGREIINWTKSV